MTPARIRHNISFQEVRPLSMDQTKQRNTQREDK